MKKFSAVEKETKSTAVTISELKNYNSARINELNTNTPDALLTIQKFLLEPCTITRKEFVQLSESLDIIHTSEIVTDQLLEEVESILISSLPVLETKEEDEFKKEEKELDAKFKEEDKNIEKAEKDIKEMCEKHLKGVEGKDESDIEHAIKHLSEMIAIHYRSYGTFCEFIKEQKEEGLIEKDSIDSVLEEIVKKYSC